MQHQEAAIAEERPTSTFARVNGLQLHYLDWGVRHSSGGHAQKHRPRTVATTILLCHGGSAHCHWWDEVAPQLAECGQVLALDFRGHGRSQWASQYGLSAHLDDLVTFVRDHLRRRVVLVGHSMGGEIAMRLAVKYPQLLDGLVIADASPAGLPLRTRLVWRWKRRKQSGLRPQFPTAEMLIARFRLSPPGHNLTPAALAALALKGAEQLPSGNWAFRLDPTHTHAIDRLAPGQMSNSGYPAAGADPSRRAQPPGIGAASAPNAASNPGVKIKDNTIRLSSHFGR